MKLLPLLLLFVVAVPTHEPTTLAQTAKNPAQEQAPQKEATKPVKSEFEFIRLRKDGRKLMAMETNVVRYTNSIKYPGATVDLIGAIHMADPDYYDKLNQLFTKYDVLLYEAVKDEGVDVSKRQAKGKPNRGGRSQDGVDTETMVGLSAIGILQMGMKDALGLEYQMQGIDYAKKNFVHADMTTREFQRSMQRRGESFGSMMLKEMGKAATQDMGNPLAQQIDLMFSLMSSDREIRVRRIVASQLAKASTAEAFADENGESTIITERNKKALGVLEEQLDKGVKKIGIFYGAAHMPDMEKRLREEFYFKRGDTKWLQAWKLRRDKAKKKEQAEPKAEK